MNTHRSFTISQGRTARASEKLSSGYRINRAGDDAAGLAISEKMRGQIRGLTRASANALDGVSLIQTAEGALQEAHSILQRMTELSVQAASDTNALLDREALNLELQQLKGELDDISTTTTFNGKTLLDGSYARGDFSARALGGPLLRFYEAAFDGFVTEQTGSGTSDVTNPKWDGMKETLTKQILPNVVSGIMGTFSSLSNALSGSDIGVGLNLVNGASYGAQVSTSWRIDGDTTTVNYTLSINVNQDFFAADGSIRADKRSDFEALIAHEMTHLFMAEATRTGMVGDDTFPLWFVEGMAQSVGGDLGWLDATGLTASSTDAQVASVMKNLGKTDSYSTYAVGYLATMYLGHAAGGGGTPSSSTIAAGINKILGDVIGGQSLDQAIAGNTGFAGLDDFVSKVKSGSAAGLSDFVRGVAGINASNPNALMSLAGGSLTAADLAADSTAAQSVFIVDADHRSVSNVYPAGADLWTSGGSKSGPGRPAANSGGGALSQGPLILQVGANAGDEMEVYLENMSADSLGVGGLDITTQADASTAIDACQQAVNDVSSMRARLGAYQNRLEHKINNLSTSAENLQAAESRIRDMDMAKGMTDFARNQILEQAGIAMMGQMNAQPQGVLQLLS